MGRVGCLEGDPHAGLRQQPCVGERRVISIVFAVRHAQHRADDDRDVFGLELVGDAVRLDAAGDDQLDLHLVGEGDGALDVALRVGGDDHRQGAAHDRDQGFQLQVNVLFRQAGVFGARVFGVAIGAGVAENLLQTLHLFFLLPPGLRGRAARALETELGADAEAARPVDVHGDGRLQQHVARHPAVEVDQRALP